MSTKVNSNMSIESQANHLLDEDIVISTNSFDCMKNAINKAGFREGAIAGKEKNVQTGFDVGYQEGFNAGKSIGYLKGLHFATQALSLPGADSQQQTDETHPNVCSILNNSSRGICQLCVDDHAASQLEDETESISVDSVSEIVRKQSIAVDNALLLLRETYKFAYIDVAN